MCFQPPKTPPVPAAPPPPPAVPQLKPQAVQTDPLLKAEQRTASRLGTNQLVIPLKTSLNIPT